MPKDSSIDVYISATATNPYTFKAGDFPFEDADGDALSSISIETLPDKGTLRVGESDATQFQQVTAAAIPTITWRPALNQSAGNNHTSFTFGVHTRGRSIMTGTVTINLIYVNSPATGAIIILDTGGFALTDTHAPDEHEALAARADSITDADGLNVNLTSSQRWQWSADDAGNGVFAAIAGATMSTFTPRAGHTGNALQVCYSFTDDRGGMEQVCATTQPVADVNSAPVAIDNTVSVPWTATENAQFSMNLNHFTFEDADHHGLHSLIITALPSRGTLTFAGVTVRSSFLPSQLSRSGLVAGRLAYYPAPNVAQQAAAGYDSFTFQVVDNGPGAEASSASATLTIDLVAPAMQMPATGMPSIIGVLDPVTGGYQEGQILASNTVGIDDPNGINQQTLTREWQVSATENGPWTQESSSLLLLEQKHVGGYVRLCISFDDLHPAPNREGPLCTMAFPVANLGDQPIPQDRTIQVRLDASMASPYRFTAADFPFEDEDNDGLASITLESIPAVGTLRVGDAAAVVGQVVDVDDIPAINYYPEPGQASAEGYASFRFRLTDDSNDGGRSDSLGAGTITINLGGLTLRLRLFLEGPLR